MTKNVSSAELGQNIDDLLNLINESNFDVVIEQEGKAKAVLISMDQYQAWFKRREQAFDNIKRIGTEARAVWEAEGKTEAEMLEMVNDLVEESRKEPLAVNNS